MVAISNDRFFNITYPNRFPFLFSKKFQLAFIFILIGLNYIYYSFLTWNSYLISNNITNITMVQSSCQVKYDYLLLAWIDFLNSTAFPFVFMFFSKRFSDLLHKKVKVKNSKSSNESTRYKVCNHYDFIKFNVFNFGRTSGDF
jgi:phosphotransferase system  glucose/maltose/N-acetylglucosamine-specific IIC component